MGMEVLPNKQICPILGCLTGILAISWLEILTVTEKMTSSAKKKEAGLTTMV
jgi:hypothetical protein